jgi:IPT/TIG domain
LLPLASLQVGGWDSRLNHTGSLLYSVFNSVVISDTHNGRPLLNLPLPAGTIGAGSSVSSYRPLAIDPTGQKILVATQTGVSYFELSVIPLAVGTVSPSSGSAGTSVQIRGSGFVSGTAAQIGGQNATCTETDSETLSCTIPNLPAGSAPMILSNPDGQTYAFENAFQVQ